MTNLQAFEKLDLLADEAQILIETFHVGGFCDAEWSVYIRPIGGGFPLAKAHGETLSEAVKQAVELWETK